MSLELPVLDLRLWYAGGEARRQFLMWLGEAARDVGFFYLVGHGVAQSQPEAILQLAADFFALPIQEKRKVEMVHSPHFRGYIRLGGELTLGQADQREQFEITRNFGVAGKGPCQRSAKPAVLSGRTKCVKRPLTLAP